MRRLLLLSLSTAMGMVGQEYTRGVGVYPGSPAEYAGPTMVTDATTYRNLALHRPAYHSSSYDYNLTAQLATDGIKDTRLPRWVSTSVSERGTLTKQERELVLDHNLVTSVELRGPHPWVAVGLEGGDGAPEVDRLDVFARPRGFALDPARWTCSVLGSDDERTWKELGRKAGAEKAARDYQWSIVLAAPSRSRFYRVAFEAPNVKAWRANEVAFFDHNEKLGVGGPYQFTSAWMSAGSGEEWVYVDLGARCTFDRVAMYWIRRAAAGSIQVSDDAAEWTTLQAI